MPHTPGPWLKTLAHDRYCINSDSRPIRVADVILRTPRSDEDLDNANLIIAAPDLFDACAMASGFLENAQGAGKVVAARLNAALAKTKGGV